VPPASTYVCQYDVTAVTLRPWPFKRITEEKGHDMSLNRTLAAAAAAAGLAVGVGVITAPSASADSYWYSPARVVQCTNPHAPPFSQPYSIPVRGEHQQGVYGGVTKHRISKSWFGIGTPGAPDYNGGNAIIGWTVREQDATHSIGGGDFTFASGNAGASWAFTVSQTPLHAGRTWEAMVLRWKDGSTCSARWELLPGA
jgi:hypothetical protein